MKLRIAAIGGAVSLGIFLAAAPAFAATPQERMKACAEEWNAAKAAKTVPPGQTWKDYLKECSTRTGAAPATPAAPPSTAAQTPAPASAAGAGTPQSRMKQCSAEWQAAKAAKTVPQGQTWQKFYTECNTRLQGSAPAPATAAPASPPAQPAAAAKPATATPAATPAATPTPAAPAAAPATTATRPEDEDTGEGSPQPTPAQLAARERIKQCGAEWRSLKEAGKIAAGETWPHFWSTCNTRLKASGK